MSDGQAGPTRSSIDLKSAQLPVVAVVLKTTDAGQLAAELASRLEGEPGFFDGEPVAIDLSAVQHDPQPIDFVALVAELRRHHARPVAVRGGSDAQMEAARACGLVAAPDAPHGREPAPVATDAPAPAAHAPAPAVPVPGPGTVVVDRPLRSGQQVYARGADLVVLSMVSFGAEVIADGNIHVYAPLRGRAIAGARGDTSARIFSTCLEPQLVSIAGMYRTTETELPDEVRGRPAQVRLEGERILIEPL
ncbi:septum site-determining protein MinC [Melaminivora alkalimesophila]|uniref:Probable septum site-determining protein MinC n=2 Tax=Melaminivora alkalimesophila TaxID=1165852 RepID=A0A317RBY1_9BURK|nr:septum site-determining protein MinC [Melaminivora alkalimesophila]PWW46972.1 septum site-determining protein MinC [Melaminivora alkalimesophila]